jgi:hypothetical protein
MPRTSTTSSSRRSSDSEYLLPRYINLEFCMNALHCREDIATTIHLTNNERSTFTEILFLDHTIHHTEQQLEREKQRARD